MFLIAWIGLEFSIFLLGKMVVNNSYDCFLQDDMWLLCLFVCLFFNMRYFICIVFQNTYTVKISSVKILGLCTLNEQLESAKHGFIFLFFMKINSLFWLKTVPYNPYVRYSSVLEYNYPVHVFPCNMHMYVLFRVIDAKVKVTWIYLILVERRWVE